MNLFKPIYSLLLSKYEHLKKTIVIKSFYELRKIPEFAIIILQQYKKTIQKYQIIV